MLRTARTIPLDCDDDCELWPDMCPHINFCIGQCGIAPNVKESCDRLNDGSLLEGAGLIEEELEDRDGAFKEEEEEEEEELIRDEF